MLTNVAETVWPAPTALTTPDIVKATVLPSLAKTVIVIVAVFVLFETFVTRAVAPALPKSELKVALSNLKDLLCMALDLVGVGAALEPFAATHTSEHVSC